MFIAWAGSIVRLSFVDVQLRIVLMCRVAENALVTSPAVVALV